MKNLKHIWLISKSVIIICMITFYNSCAEDDTVINCVPRTNVSATYDLNLPLFSNLQVPDQYVVLEADGTNGSRGLILYNTGKKIIAYDRNAPHICPNKNSTLVVKENIIIECPADGAQWMLLRGEPLNNQTSGRSLRQFYVQIDGNLIYITN